jgi:hypothetical protein
MADAPSAFSLGWSLKAQIDQIARKWDNRRVVKAVLIFFGSGHLLTDQGI